MMGGQPCAGDHPTAAYLAEKGCEVVVAPTPEAIHAFNKAHGKKVGLFHVIC
jgi:hypothetical protein